MKFASLRIEAEWNDPRLSPMVRAIVTEAADHALERYEWEFTLTSIQRSDEEDQALGGSGVHVAWRAVDVRTRDRHIWMAERVGEWINERWRYDSRRPRLQCCVYKPHGTGRHLHVQVHPNTRRVE